jgi:hypothetical protein
MTTQKKNTMMPGMAYPATVLALATAPSYPLPPDLFGGCLPGTTTLKPSRSGVGITSGRLVRRPAPVLRFNLAVDDDPEPPIIAPSSLLSKLRMGTRISA